MWIDDSGMCQRLLPRFARAVFGKTSSIIRFLVHPLDEEYYKECVEIFENLPEDARLSVVQTLMIGSACLRWVSMDTQSVIETSKT